MRILVVGAGHQGSACLWDLARQRAVTRLALADRDSHLVDAVTENTWAHGVHGHVVDVTDIQAAGRLLSEYDVAVSAVPYLFNETLTRAAIQGCCHLVDMGGNTKIVMAQKALDDEARRAGVTILPDGGLAPGLGSVLAGHLIREENPHEVRIRVGGLPQDPRPPLGYSLFFSPYGLLNEYAGQALALRAGAVHRLPVLEEEESLEFPPLGRLEAALTSGGASTLPYTFEGAVSELDYKTIRFRGHFEKIRVLRDLGFIEDRSLTIPPLAGGSPLTVSLRDIVGTMLQEKLGGREVEDQVLVRVTARSGERARILEMRDLYDTANEMTAMRRCTAFPVAVEALFLGEGSLRSGVLSQEKDVDATRLIRELGSRGIQITERVEGSS
jgi:lysine 6-dehydrogenase